VAPVCFIHDKKNMTFFLTTCIEMKKDPGLPKLGNFKQKKQNKEEERRKKVEIFFL
jgi:hypothetical protein